MGKVAVNDFVRRQIKGSGKTYSKSLSFEEIATDAESQMIKGHFEEGYRDGVRIVIGSQNLLTEFICPFVKIDNENYQETQFAARRFSEYYTPHSATRFRNGRLIPRRIYRCLHRTCKRVQNG